MTQKHRFIAVAAALAALVLVVALTGCGGSSDASSAQKSDSSSTSGSTSQPSQSTGSTSAADGKLQITDIKVGTGAAVKAGDTITVNYTGWLYVDGKKTTAFDSSTDAKFNHVQPAQFQIGVGQLIPGWDQGIPGMKVGGTRALVIPPSLGYGAQGQPPTIPANSTLYFEVTLVSIP